MFKPRGFVERAMGKAFAEMRKEIAEFYRDNQRMTVKDTMRRFKCSYSTVKKALNEHGVVVERQRSPLNQGRGYQQHRCDKCGEVFRHYCKSDNAVAVQHDTHIDPADIAAMNEKPNQALILKYRELGIVNEFMAACVAAKQASDSAPGPP